MEPAAVSPCLLTIAGFDPSSGAGITADLAVFAAHGCFGTSAISALTVQSTTGVRRAQPADADVLAETLACLQQDLPPQGIKIGMLADQPQVEAVCRYLENLKNLKARPFVVLDPVLRSTSGAALMTESGLRALKESLLPLVDVVTPNAAELAVLTGLPCQHGKEIRDATSALSANYSGLSIVVTGGDGPKPDDLLLHQGVETVLHGTRVESVATHGTGCAFSSALLCRRVLGEGIHSAAKGAKRYVETAIRRAEPRGKGRGPMRLLWPLQIDTVQ